jgi:hypothetical protein
MQLKFRPESIVTSKITVSSWEDAGGAMNYVKGEANDTQN